MKKFYKLTFLLAALMISGSLIAQDTLDVAPGATTLNAAITANGGDKVYRLEAAGWYGLDAIIENVDYHLQIVGEDYDDSTLPATIQTGMTGEGVPFEHMFAAKGNLTLKNVYVMNADINGQIPNRCIVQSDSGSFVEIDNCVLDPMGQTGLVQMTGGDNDLWFTNNIAARHGHMIGANDGHAFIINDANASVGADSVLLENNTFISTGMNLLSGNFAAHVTNFLMINHNTFIHHKSQIDWSILENEYYLTNNLFFDFMSSAYAYNWQPMPGGDASMPKPMLIYADTIGNPLETLPTDRSQYVQYNNMYWSQGLFDLMAEMNDTAAATGAAKMNLHPLIWDGTTDPKMGADPAEAFAASREGHLFNHANNVNTDFPNWKFGNTTYGTDPLWNESMIYDLSDSLVKWQRPASFIHAQGQSADRWPDPNTWAKWHWDPDGDVAINDTWPLIDATYTDAATLTGSVARLPLGDLNWYPAKKAAWVMHKDEIFAHMKAGNTDKWGSIGVGPAMEAGDFSKIYPNPMVSTATVEFTLTSSADVEIALYNAIGQQVKSVLSEVRATGTHSVTFDRGDLNNGLYFCRIKAGNQTETQKLMILE
jgi:hypothetical protein